MDHAKTLAYTCLGISLSCIIFAVMLGVAAAGGGWETSQVIGSTAALAAVAEVSFWLGGGLLGFEAVKRKRLGFERVTERLVLWRRS